MSKMNFDCEFPKGTEVLITSGFYKGRSGKVVQFCPVFLNWKYKIKTGFWFWQYILVQDYQIECLK